MGGMHTLMATNNNPDLFGWIGVFSMGEQDSPENMAALAKIKAGGVKHYWVGGGTTDFLLDASHSLYEMAQKAGLNASWHTAPGAHYWFIWRQFLSEYTPLLFK
jgi:enterochelin esterase-like enzyme